MKIENTPEAKARFFALYWGQGIMKEDGKYGVNTYKVGYLDEGREEQWLQLAPLSQISDVDAVEVAKIILCELRDPIFNISKGYSINYTEIDETVICVECQNFVPYPGASRHYLYSLIQIDTEENDIITGRFENDGKILTDDHSDNILHAYDYLRSKGYALPWTGLSVDEQVECGWVKLKEVQS